MQEAELVKEARQGNRRALEHLIDLVTKQKPSSKRSTYAKLELFAFKWAHVIQDWDKDDIINEMRACVWKAAMGKSGNWDPEKSKVGFVVFCWVLLKRRVANQLAYEGANKRGSSAGRVAFDEVLEQALPHVSIDHSGRGMELRGDACFEVEKLRRKLDTDDVIILNLLLKGYQYTEIARIMSTPHNKWSDTQVRTRVRSAIATPTLKESLKK